MPPRAHGTVAAHVERFVDEIDEPPPSPGTFERVSDEEETEQAEAVTTTKKKLLPLIMRTVLDPICLSLVRRT